ncbi:MAG: COG3014 family protein [Pseudobdellovibrionaceae bacterium]
MTFFLKRSFILMGLFLLNLNLIACATYQGKVAEARQQLTFGQYEAAEKYLEPLANKEGRDQLVYLLDYSVALQMGGKIKESALALQRADRLADFQDYTSLSHEASSLLLNQEMVQYKGDSFEKIYINAYAALDYLELNQLDEALVETRRMNEKYNKINHEDRKTFEKNVFGKYLSAMIWEANQNWDDAYIAYEEAYNLDPNIPFLAEDLIRSAKRARRTDAYQKWKKVFPQETEKKEWYDRNYGELIIIYEQGWGPRKTLVGGQGAYAGGYNPPILQPVYNTILQMKAAISGDGEVKSRIIYDVEKAAIQTLQNDYAWLAAKRLGAFATKEVVADQIRQKNETLGNLAWLAMHLSERADLRQWSTLPQTVQLIRVPLKVGEYNVNLQGLLANGVVSGEGKAFSKVQIKSQRITFLRWRTLK